MLALHLTGQAVGGSFARVKGGKGIGGALLYAAPATSKQVASANWVRVDAGIKSLDFYDVNVDGLVPKLGKSQRSFPAFIKSPQHRFATYQAGFAIGSSQR